MVLKISFENKIQQTDMKLVSKPTTSDEKLFRRPPQRG